jgi:chromosome segregation ATPase
VLFLSFAAKKWMVLELISWKHSFRKLTEENEMAKKKKQALDNLLNSGRISQSTYELIGNEIGEAIAEIERQQQALLEKMNSKMADLEEQIKMLEMLLANSEIQHVTGEVDEEVYLRETNLLSTGLETSRQELSSIRDAVNQLSTGIQPLGNEISNVGVEMVEVKESASSQTSPAESQPTETVTKDEEKQGTQQ